MTDIQISKELPILIQIDRNHNLKAFDYLNQKELLSGFDNLGEILKIESLKDQHVIYGRNGYQ